MKKPLRNKVPAMKPGENLLNPRGFRVESLEGGHSDRLRTLIALGDLELNSLILVKRAKTASLNLRVVDENIFFAAVGADKAEALFAVEPFHGSLCHANSFSFKRM